MLDKLQSWLYNEGKIEEKEKENVYGKFRKDQRIYDS